MSKKIILGSSSITILKEVEWNLTDTDYEIIPANDIDDFRQSMKSQNPDLLIIDRDMQEGNGVSLCNEIKSNAEFAQLPLIILVKKIEDEGDGNVESLENECKADKVLGVPLESSKLLSTVQYFMAKQSAASDPLTRDLSKAVGPKAAEPAGAGAKHAGLEAPAPEMPSLDMEVPEGQVETPPELFAGLENVLEGIEISPVEETPQEATAVGPAMAEPDVAKPAAPEPLAPEASVPEMPPLDAGVLEGQATASQVGPGEVDAVLHEGEGEHPSLSADEALEETIRVVEEAVKRGRYAQGQSDSAVSPQEPAKPEEKQKAVPPPEKAQAPSADAGGAKGLSQEEIQESVMQEFLKAAFPPGESGGRPIEGEGEGVSQAPPLKGKDVDTAGALQEESVHTKPQLDTQEMETRLKGMLQEQMHTLVEQSIPELTKRLVQERMDQVISQSVPELTRNLIQEQITKLTEQSIPELTKRLVQEHMKQMVTQAIPELTKNIIQEQMGRLTEQALPEMTKKLIQEKLAQVIDEKNIARIVLTEINQNQELVSRLLAAEAPSIINAIVERKVPDLAEKIIREEIEHIKQGYG